MNREMRRAAKREARHKPPRQVVVNAHQVQAEWSKPYEPGEMLKEHNKMWAAFIRLSDGCSTRDDYNRLSMLLNIGRIRMKEIDPRLEDTFIEGQQTMQRMKDRHQSGASLGFDADGLASVKSALANYETITDASSPLQMRMAGEVVGAEFNKGQIFHDKGFLCMI